MSNPISIKLTDFDASVLSQFDGVISVLAGDDGTLGDMAKALDGVSGGAVSRAAASDVFTKAKPGDVIEISFPSGTAASKIAVVKGADEQDKMRGAGAKLAAHALSSDVLILAEGEADSAAMIYGLQLRAYNFDRHLSASEQETHEVHVAAEDTKALEMELAPLLAVAEGVHFTRDLTNEPANVLTTEVFAERLLDLESVGVDVEVLEEEDMEALEMYALLGVGQGSASPSKLVIMRWDGGGKEAPLAVVGKGVVFDTGGISLKPAAGMEAMTMDMGGAGVVAGVMKAIAARKAKANIVGVVGLVENMPDGQAQRPGDVVTSMKGDTIEVINTDAEGRLVLCDALWYVQQKIEPSGIIDLATLTGAAIIALGHENAAVFSNTSEFADKFLKSAENEGEGAWRLPLAKGYDEQLKSRVADMKNVGGRPAGCITAAQFLARFIKDDMPWIHLDIAGVASLSNDTELAPKGATGWGVRSINRMISDYYE